MASSKSPVPKKKKRKSKIICMCSGSQTSHTQNHLLIHPQSSSHFVDPQAQLGVKGFHSKNQNMYFWTSDGLKAQFSHFIHKRRRQKAHTNNEADLRLAHRNRAFSWCPWPSSMLDTLNLWDSQALIKGTGLSFCDGIIKNRAGDSPDVDSSPLEVENAVLTAARAAWEMLCLKFNGSVWNWLV